MTDQEKIIKANSLIRRFRDLVISEFSNDGESEDDVKVGHYQKLVNEAKGFLEADDNLQVPLFANIQVPPSGEKITLIRCPHCFSVTGSAGEERIEIPSITGEIEGFKTEKEFIQHLCHQIIGLSQDKARYDEETAIKRLESLYLSAKTYLFMEGDGVTQIEI